MSIDQLGQPVDVDPPRPGGQLTRLLLALLGIGVVFGVLFGVGSVVFGTFSQTEAGLCRLTVAPCTALSVGSVEQLSGVDLPEGTVVVSGYAQELASLREFRAEVVLPEGGRVTMSDAYGETDEGSPTELIDPRFWARPIIDGDGYDTAVIGTRADGRTVIVFDERWVTRSP